MTIQRTREIFGKKFAHKTDQEVLEFIQKMGIMGDELLELILSDTLTPLSVGKYPKTNK